jgi:hypothetical protein
MTYSLAAAAAATGTDESTILKSIEDGEIAATKDSLGEWQVESAELQRVYPSITKVDSDGDAARCAAMPAEAIDLEGQIAALIKQAGDRLRQQLDEVKSQAPKQPPSDKPERDPWWRRIAG